MPEVQAMLPCIVSNHSSQVGHKLLVINKVQVVFHAVEVSTCASTLQKMQSIDTPKSRFGTRLWQGPYLPLTVKARERQQRLHIPSAIHYAYQSVASAGVFANTCGTACHLC